MSNSVPASRAHHPVLELACPMTKETKNCLLEGTFELLVESETLFVYVLIPLLCIIGIYLLGAAFFVDAHPTAASAASDLFSIDPDKWFPRA
jgi:hypothetical protein